MPTLKARLQHEQAVARGESLPLVVTPEHYAWLARPESQRTPNPKALAHATAVLKAETKRAREHRISASSLGEPCTRRVLFAYAGAEQVPFPPQNIDIMDLGSWLHLKWQVEGLTAGWLTEAETFFHSPALRLGGSTDGIMRGDELFELKTVGGHVYDRVVRAKAPKREHELQCEGYFELSGMSVASIVYVCRETGAFHEYRYATNPVRRQELHRIVEDLHDWIDLDLLPDMLEECVSQTGSVYRRCPYREICPASVRIGAAS